MEHLLPCVENEERVWAIDEIYTGMCPASIIPRAATSPKSVKTGRWGRVILRTNVAVKIQKVFCHKGQFRHVEWRGGTKVTLDCFQELIAARLFGELGIAPRITQVVLAKRIPAWVDKDCVVDYRGSTVSCEQTWNLIFVMERLTGTLRDLTVMSPKQLAAFWNGVDITRLAKVIRTLTQHDYEHCDVRLDNVGYKRRKNGSVKIYALDFGYGKLQTDRQLEHRVKRKFAKVLLQAHAPTAVVHQMNFALAKPLATSSML